VTDGDRGLRAAPYYGPGRSSSRSVAGAGRAAAQSVPATPAMVATALAPSACMA
jgi:hypothetical protein